MKKLLSLIGVLALSCTLVTPIWAANESAMGVVQPYDGIYEPVPDRDDLISIIVDQSYLPAEQPWADRTPSDVRLVADRGVITLYFSVAGLSYETVLEQTSIGEELGTDRLSIGVAGYSDRGGGFNYWQEENKEYIGNGVFDGEKGWIEIHRLVKISEKESDKPIELSESFMQKVTTDSGQYEMYLSGFLTMSLVNGENTLTSEQIQAQSINIHVKNMQNGVTRVMTQSTIEGLTVQVSQGRIKELTIKGRVQTSGGTLERYTTVISF